VEDSVFLEERVLPDRLEVLDLVDQLVIPDHKVRRDQKVHLAHRDHKDR